MDKAGITIHFPDVTPDLGNVYAEDLRASLEESLEAGGRVERRRSSSESEDIGPTVVLLLGTSAVTAIAQGIKTWLARNSGVSIDIVVRDRVFRARNLDSHGVRELAKVLAASGE
jgi:hypothetical protein